MTAGCSHKRHRKDCQEILYHREWSDEQSVLTLSLAGDHVKSLSTIIAQHYTTLFVSPLHHFLLPSKPMFTKPHKLAACNPLTHATYLTHLTLLTYLTLSTSISPSSAQSPTAWYEMPAGETETRWFTFENPGGEKGQAGKTRFGRKGAPATPINSGQNLVLADIQGSGTIRRIWATIFHRSPQALRGLKIEMYWDDATNPAVQAPLGDFFCHSLGQMATFENACFYSPEGRSFNCLIPMPFRKSAKIVLVNDSKYNNGIYYEVDATTGDKHDQDALYFHSYWRRENPTTLRQDMTILPRIEGRGRFLGCNLGIRQNPCCTNFWFGEGEVKVYLDGDNQLPTLCGTGTEDYLGDAYGQGLFNCRYSGNQYVSPDKSAYGFYRLHIPDPVWFHKDIRVTIQVMGGPSYRAMLDSMDRDRSLKFMKAGDGTQYYTREELAANPRRAEVMERTDDYCATAYWYQSTPENHLPPIAPAADRMKDLP
ncbi:MAG: DUF2961 domain-containing protein [Verrucomicrobia bacterium]|nr:MAG: DUF2961 domain-containing protein [Verrucomicrobiota bacterium]